MSRARIVERPRDLAAASFAALVGFAALLLAGASTASAAPGDLDWSFSRDGRVLTDVAGGDAGANAVAIQPDGGIVVAGFSASPGDERRFALVRYHPDGTRDPSFGRGGIVTTRFGDRDAAGEAVALEPDGRILAAGTASRPETGWDFALARYNPDGSLDPSFGHDGRLTTDFAGGADAAYALGLRPDGKLLLAGESQGDFALARYAPSGDLDPSFGGDGLVATDFAGLADGADALALQPDGGLVAAGFATKPPGGYGDRVSALARYGPDGALDPSFGGDGRAIAQGAGRTAYAVARQEDGRIVVAGDGGLARVDADGSPDPSFDGGGSSRTYVRDVRGLAVQPDRRLLAAGSTGYSYSTDFQVSRWDSNGSFDSAFGAVSSSQPSYLAGAVSDFGTFRDDVARAVAIQADGKVVAVGRSAPGYYSPGDFAVARYRVDTGPEDADADGVPDQRDLCPRRYAAGEPDGCPHYPRWATIRYSDRDRAFEGHVSSEERLCAQYARVVIFERRPAGDVRVGRHGYGPHYVVEAPRRRGRYYAEVPKRYWPELGICEAARSDVVRLRK